MYENIGGKIKALAVWIFGIETLATIIWAITLVNRDEDFTGIATLIIFIGPILARVSSLALYGFGELVEKTSAIAKKIGADELKEFNENTLSREDV